MRHDFQRGTSRCHARDGRSGSHNQRTSRRIQRRAASFFMVWLLFRRGWPRCSKKEMFNEISRALLIRDIIGGLIFFALMCCSLWMLTLIERAESVGEKTYLGLFETLACIAGSVLIASIAQKKIRKKFFEQHGLSCKNCGSNPKSVGMYTAGNLDRILETGRCAKCGTLLEITYPE